MKDLTNVKSGKLTVLSFSHKKAKKRGFDYYWNCKCECGKEIKVNATNLFREHYTKSCGCGRASGIWKGVGEISASYFAVIRHNAKKRGIEFKISLEEIWQLFLEQKKKCALTGVDLKFAHSYGKDEQTASLDRIDSDKDYTKDNLMWVHKEVNGMRLTISLDKFKNWCKLVAEYERIV